MFITGSVLKEDLSSETGVNTQMEVVGESVWVH